MLNALIILSENVNNLDNEFEQDEPLITTVPAHLHISWIFFCVINGSLVSDLYIRNL